MLQAQVSIVEIAQRLTASVGYRVKNAMPKKPEGGWITFDLSREQFLLAQRIVSGAELGASVEASLGFLEARDVRLALEENDGQPYCKSGWFIHESTPFLWYETTSGTVLGYAFSEVGEESFQILLPKGRAMGKHHMELARVKAGMTSDQYDRWYGSEYLEGKEETYAEMSAFHNAHLVRLGWKPIWTGRQEKLEREMTHILHPVYGDWAQNYGIGRSVKDIIGQPGEIYVSTGYEQPPLAGQRLISEGESILRSLKAATQEWEALLATWRQNPSGEEIGEEIEDKDVDKRFRLPGLPKL